VTLASPFGPGMLSSRVIGKTRSPKPGEPIESVATAAAFARWLARHHRTASAVWIKIAKSGAGPRSITYNDAMDVALCYGWIDSQAKSLDAAHFLLRYTPRSPRSKWSKANRDRVARLAKEGRMRPSGLAEVERAKVEGRWG
jgi:uncharacterized protein YdeI (YjbR/CyaY-like superfamily)